MRLLFINRFFYPDRSATARLLTDLAEDLTASGIAVTVITGRVGYLEIDHLQPHEACYQGIIVRRVWSTRFGREFLIGRLADCLTFLISAGWAVIRCSGVDTLVVLTDPPMLSFLAAWLGRIKGWKTICWLQDVFPENAVQAGLLADRWPARLLARLVRWSLRTSDRVIVVGRCMERRMLRAGLSASRLTRIPNWDDGKNLAPVASEQNWFRTAHGLDGSLVVMYSGNLGLMHDANSLMRVIRALHAMPEICFVFMVYGKGKARLEQWARREGLTKLRFIDYQNREHLSYSLSAGDLHLVSLRDGMEGLSVPSKVYGIMAVGRPVVFIGPEESEVAAVVREANCGEVHPPSEPDKAAAGIRNLLLERERRELLGQAGRRYFEAMLDKPHALERFKKVFEELL